jgi:hypothetical protein
MWAGLTQNKQQPYSTSTFLYNLSFSTLARRIPPKSQNLHTRCPQSLSTTPSTSCCPSLAFPSSLLQSTCSLPMVPTYAPLRNGEYSEPDARSPHTNVLYGILKREGPCIIYPAYNFPFTTHIHWMNNTLHDKPIIQLQASSSLSNFSIVTLFHIHFYHVFPSLFRSYILPIPTHFMYITTSVSHPLHLAWDHKPRNKTIIQIPFTNTSIYKYENHHHPKQLHRIYQIETKHCHRTTATFRTTITSRKIINIHTQILL